MPQGPKNTPFISSHPLTLTMRTEGDQREVLVMLELLRGGFCLEIPCWAGRPAPQLEARLGAARCSLLPSSGIRAALAAQLAVQSCKDFRDCKSNK